MRKSDIVSGLLLLILGLVSLLYIIPTQVSSRNIGGLPPDFFPRLLNWIFLGLAVLLLATRLIAAWRKVPSAEPPDFPITWQQAGFITGISVFLYVTYMLMVSVNFITAGIFAVVVSGALMGELRTNPIRLAIVAVTTPVVTFYIFRHLFMVYLPA